MIEKFKHYSITLFVLGFFLTGCGLWFIFNPQPAIDIPEEDPLIYMKVTEPSGMYAKQVEIFEDGTVIYLRENWTDEFSLNQPDSRLWKKGTISEADIEELTSCIHSDNLSKMQDCYICGTANNSEQQYSMELTLHINCSGICKTISALGYITPDNGVTYPDLPDPLDDIYMKIRYFGEYKTEEVFFEELNTETSY